MRCSRTVSARTDPLLRPTLLCFSEHWPQTPLGRAALSHSTRGSVEWQCLLQAVRKEAADQKTALSQASAASVQDAAQRELLQESLDAANMKASSQSARLAQLQVRCLKAWSRACGRMSQQATCAAQRELLQESLDAANMKALSQSARLAQLQVSSACTICGVCAPISGHAYRRCPA